jgi:hypothetical protein
MDKIRLHREILKQALFNADCSNIPVRKEIIVDLRYIKNKWWPGYGYVQILNDGPDGYSSFNTHQENPLQYAKDRINDKDSLTDYSKYKLIIKE